MTGVTNLGITIPRSLLLAHLAILLRPARDPSTFEALPAEIITRIAEVATERFIFEQELAQKAKNASNGGNAKCCCCGGTHFPRVAKEVEALGATSRRIRAVMVAAGFFSAMTIDTTVDQLFGKCIVATEGFLENAKVVVMRLSYTGPQNAPLDVPNLRHAFGLYPSTRDLWLDWSLTNTSAAVSSPLPPLPPTRGIPPPEEILQGLKTVTLNISDRKGNLHALLEGSSRPLMAQHLDQLLPIFSVPTLEELDIRMHYQETGISVRKALRTTGEKLKGLKMAKLKRLGITLHFELDFKKEISGGWLSVLVKLLTLASQISPVLTDIEITICIKANNSKVFTRSPTTDEVSLAGLVPTREQVLDSLRQLAASQGRENLLPFTFQIMAESSLLPMATCFMVLEYIPATYIATPEKRQTLPERMLDVPESLAKRPLSGREALGEGDDLRFAINHAGIEDLYVDVLSMETVRRAGLFSPSALPGDEDDEWEDVEEDDYGLPLPMPMPFDLGVEDMPLELEMMISSMMMAALAAREG